MTDRCIARIYYKDIPRRTGRGSSGFEREWSWRQCKRGQKNGDGLCEQHFQMKKRGFSVTTI